MSKVLVIDVFCKYGKTRFILADGKIIKKPCPIIYSPEFARFWDYICGVK